MRGKQGQPRMPMHDLSAVIANLLLLLVVTEEKISQLNIVTVAEYITTALSVNQMALL